ncbi:CBN-DRSH-1 protein [Caenorhabditis brenneri]|uniref:CBN-DRSH-1 protein n=1 Tax=Caenorhabditis brenneri TaxID=135651 RepID=G0P7Q1_CAEBE|nr:CBN-DRSH-1 protein [Caenorhabditis brenneri]
MVPFKPSDRNRRTNQDGAEGSYRYELRKCNQKSLDEECILDDYERNDELNAESSTAFYNHPDAKENSDDTSEYGPSDDETLANYPLRKPSYCVKAAIGDLFSRNPHPSVSEMNELTEFYSVKYRTIFETMELKRNSQKIFVIAETIVNVLAITFDNNLLSRTHLNKNPEKDAGIQANVPYVEFPCHSLDNKHPIREKMKKENNENNESSSDSSQSSDAESKSEGSESEKEEEEEKEEAEESGGGVTRNEKRKEQRRIALEKKREEKEKLSVLLKMAAERKKTHPNGLHPDISFNEKDIGNDGPECRCPPSIQNNGLKHGYYAGENKVIDCTRTGGANLYYYTMRVFPAPNDTQIHKTQMQINGDMYTFQGFSLVTHAPLPICMTRRPICMYAMDYEFQLVEEKVPDECFAPEDCDDLQEYIFHEIFEMMNFQLRPKHVPAGIETCPMIHIMPRFECFKDGLVHLWSSKTVLAYFLSKGGTPLFDKEEVSSHSRLNDEEFTRNTGRLKQSIILNTQFKPSAVRADWFERDAEKREVYFVHNAIRSASYPIGIAARIAKLENTLNKLKNEKRNSYGMPNPEYEATKLEMDKLKEEARAARILKLREPVAGYIDTGLKPDVVAHIAMVTIACHHIRYNFSISVFEEIIQYQFNDRRLIELAFIHSSFRTSYGTPIDHVKNIVNNCGYRRKYGTEEKREKKKGIVSLFNIMGGEIDGEPILHNERLEYLGDAVVELITSHHLFFMLPHHFEGGLATYRTALVQNRNLAKLAKSCRMDEMLQFAHGADLINEADFKHALANSFEAVMAAVYLDGGLGPCDTIFSKAMYGNDPELKQIWDHCNEHELRREDPLGDRELSQITPALASFHELERRLGIQFNNIRLLAKAFTRRNVPNNDLTKGHNQRLEWLGDSVLQLLISDFLYKNFPNHHEGHMSLLRTSLVSNQTQSVVCDDLGFLEGERLSTGAASNVHKAELKAAESALADLESVSASRGNTKSKKHRRLRRFFF